MENRVVEGPEQAFPFHMQNEIYHVNRKTVSFIFFFAYEEESTPMDTLRVVGLLPK